MFGTCCVCGKRVDGGFDEGLHYFIDRKPCHRECYFKELGEMVEKHPIGHPRTR